MCLIPSPSPVWKAIVLPGLLFGILLALIQLSLLLLSPALGFAPFLNGSSIIWFAWFFYLGIPALLAYLVRRRTGEPFMGYRVGMLTGVFCSLILLFATVILIIYSRANPPVQTYHGLGAGGLINVLLMILLGYSIFFNLVGAILSILGAFLGSRKWRRGASSEEQRGR
jgi:hypothetical protein